MNTLCLLLIMFICSVQEHYSVNFIKVKVESTIKFEV